MTKAFELAQLGDKVSVDGSGNVSVDTNTLVVDAANNRVGIGVGNPADKLSVVGSGVTTVAVRTTDTSGANVGRIRIDYTGGGGGTASQVDLRAGDGYTYLVSPSNTPMLFGTNNTEAMRITSTGSVGLGTSSPGTVRLLAVASSDYSPAIQATSNSSALNWARLDVKNTNVTGSLILYQDQNGNAVVRNDTATGSLAFATNGANERMRITSTGSVGIGTSSPDALLTVKGQTVIGSSVADSANLTNLTSGTPPQLVAGWSVPAITWTPNASTEAVFTRDGAMQVDILAGANSFSNINFSDPDDEDVGQISYDHNTDAMRFRTNNTERMRITSSGNVGIGTSSPDRALTNAGNITSTRGDNPWYELVETDGTTTHNKVRLYLTGDDFIIQSRSNADGFLSNDYRIFRGASGATAHQWSIAGTERMRITSAGSVGIGTSSPTGLLTLGTATPRLDFLESNGSAGFDNTILIRDTDVFSIQTRNGGTFVSNDYRMTANASGALTHEWRIGNVERMRIDASGNLLVGQSSTSNPGLSNTTIGIGFQPGGSIYTSVAAGPGLNSNRNSDGTVAAFRQSGTLVGTISVTTTATAYNTSSDYRLKEDVQPMVGSVDRLMALKPVNFAWKVDGSRVDGFLAHEAQAVVPEAVTGEKDGEEMQAIDQSKLVPLLTAALQEALTEIASLKARLDAANL